MPKTQNKLIKVFFSILEGVGLNLEKFQQAPKEKRFIGKLFKNKNVTHAEMLKTDCFCTC